VRQKKTNYLRIPAIDPKKKKTARKRTTMKVFRQYQGFIQEGAGTTTIIGLMSRGRDVK